MCLCILFKQMCHHVRYLGRILSMYTPSVSFLGTKELEVFTHTTIIYPLNVISKLMCQLADKANFLKIGSVCSNSSISILKIFKLMYATLQKLYPNYDPPPSVLPCQHLSGNYNRSRFEPSVYPLAAASSLTKHCKPLWACFKA